MRYLLAAAILVLAGCRQDMHDQPKYRPLSSSSFFADGRSARPLLEDTVARGHLRVDEKMYQGRSAGKPVDTIPVPITRALLDQGRERFNIYCSPCHARTGTGDGMIVQRGFRHPPSFHDPRIREKPVGHYFDVITNGFGAMASYASRVSVEERWAVIAYIRALQLSQQVSINDVPAAERQALERRSQ